MKSKQPIKHLQQQQLEYRYNLIYSLEDFNNELGEVVAGIAKSQGVRREQIYKRYEQFFNLVSMSCLYMKNPPILKPVWNQFIDYEFGGDDHDIFSPMEKVFRESIYGTRYLRKIYKKIIG